MCKMKPAEEGVKLFYYSKEEFVHVGYQYLKLSLPAALLQITYYRDIIKILQIGNLKHIGSKLYSPQRNQQKV